MPRSFKNIFQEIVSCSRINWHSHIALVLVGSLLFTSVVAGLREINAEQIIKNADSSKTFVRPWVEDGSSSTKNRLRIRQNIPEVCRLFGMSNYLKDFVIWSTHLANTVSIKEDGELSDVSMGHYIESMTCIDNQPYFPVIMASSETKNQDGSVTFTAPKVGSGPDHFLIHSGHQGACQLLGYSRIDKKSLEWSTEQSVGVSLAADGQIYLTELGTYLKSLSCIDEI